jgi:hypothetical protein
MAAFCTFYHVSPIRFPFRAIMDITIFTKGEQ